jgi:formylmethanofuran dehydrogenase subunit E
MENEYYAYGDFECEKCEEVIFKGAEFMFFDGYKICMSCWDKLIDYFHNEL